MKANLKYCHKEVTRHGETVYYFRKGHRPRIRLPDNPKSAAFILAYNAALNEGTSVYIPKNVQPNQTLGWLVTEWTRSSTWKAYKPHTRSDRQGILRPLVEEAGGVNYKSILAKDIRAGVARRMDAPHGAKRFLDTVRALFTWAITNGHASEDPTLGIKVKLPKSDGHKIWEDEQIAAYEARWPVGTRQRLALDVYRYTAMRKADALVFGPRHVKDGKMTVKTSKTGAVIHLNLDPLLLASIAATPHGETFICREDLKPYTYDSGGVAFLKWCRDAGVKGYGAHGLRKTSATNMAEAGLSEYTIMAVHGWGSAATAAIYTRKANRRKLGLEGSAKMHKFPHPPAP
ncbi:Integrase, catalytic domain containing protein [uncultured Caudovirales phage]|uniref:Integrase, catalytic domain containing protein n=1 Tax=uncultured Caudovirales phage TaxID=2100421 RepID=A0A6J5KP98_9CAUD|nr:Integrase, catalytic domain containing protein [uncultured Caudovirales phage]CAB4123681.1 Integrase, catalytic domain containing protein [uncultured Caudovirales phage]